MHSHLFQYLFHFLQSHRILGYVVIFVAMIFEGDLFLFTAAFLTHQGFFDPVKMCVTLFSGSITGDLFWYWLGLKLHTHSRFTAWVAKYAAPFDNHLRARPFHTIFISKFTYGLHHAILVRAGMLKIRLGQYIRVDAISVVIWILIVGGLGFVSSLSFDRIRHSLRFIQFGLFGAVLVFLLISYLVSKQAKKKL